MWGWESGVTNSNCTQLTESYNKYKDKGRRFLSNTYYLWYFYEILFVYLLRCGCVIHNSREICSFCYFFWRSWEIVVEQFVSNFLFPYTPMMGFNLYFFWVYVEWLSIRWDLDENLILYDGHDGFWFFLPLFSCGIMRY